MKTLTYLAAAACIAILAALSPLSAWMLVNMADSDDDA